MLIDKAVKYYGKEYDFNCAETILYAANDEYGLNLDKNTFKTMAGFGGGMAVEGICGVIAGAVAVIGIMFTKERGHESNHVRSLTKEYIEKFEEACSSTQCGSLKKVHRNDEIRCTYMMEKGAWILQDIIERENKIRIK